MKYSFFFAMLSIVSALSFFSAQGEDAQPPLICAAILDGQNNHDWKGTSPIIKQVLDRTGRFKTEFLTSPPRGGDMAAFRPDFSKYDVVVLNYTDFGGGDSWSPEMQKDFEHYVANGGGVAAVHAVISAFPKWKEFNKMMGIGGWGGRTEKDGPYIYVQDGKVVRDTSPGAAGHHGRQVEFLVKTFDLSAQHPIMKGLPAAWLHSKDEIYCKMRGPAENMTVLATADAKKSDGGSGRDEPMLYTVNYGKGRIFVTMLADNPKPCHCIGFQLTLARGTEWAATEKCTIPVPADFPTATKTSVVSE